MTHEAEVLVLQSRLNPKVEEHEQEIYREIAQGTGKQLTFANMASPDALAVPLEDPGQILSRFRGGVLVTASELFYSQPDAATERVLNRIGSLGQRIIDEGSRSYWICFGHQTLGKLAGVDVRRIDEEKETGTVDFLLTPEGVEHPLFVGMDNPHRLMVTHEDSLGGLPEGFTLTGSTLGPDGKVRNRIAAMAKGDIFSIQGHSEFTVPRVARRLELFGKKLIQDSGTGDYQQTSPWTAVPQAEIPLKRFLMR